jgi:hypothetical protein
MTEVVVQRVRTRYHWPALQLNFWLLIMLIGASTILGINASFITVQNQLEVGIPWYGYPPFYLPLLHCLILLQALAVIEQLDWTSANVFLPAGTSPTGSRSPP